MLLYLVRHAIAVAREETNGFDDASRALTDRGRKRMRQIVRGLNRLDVEIDEIWSSPLLRARQTAEVLAELSSTADADSPFVTIDALAPGGDLVALCQQIIESDPSHRIALVGHEPDSGCLATLLVRGGSSADANETAVAFKKGGVACFNLDTCTQRPTAELSWLMTPRQLRSIGG